MVCCIAILSSLFSFLISISSASECPSGWVDVGGTCFLLVNSERLPWFKAQIHCQELGGHLAEPNTEYWSNLITSIAGIESDVLGVDSWWLGLSDLGHEGRWIWQNSLEEVEFTNWAANSPVDSDFDKNCVAMKTENDLQWSDESCTNSAKASPICQTDHMETSSTTTIDPTTDSSTTIIPSAATPLDLVQLVGGDGYSSGNVIVQNSDGYFGPVCDDTWSSLIAGVVCAQLGFSRDNVTVYTQSYFGRVSPNFAMDTLTCDGTEASIQECTYDTNDNCDFNEGAGVQCYQL